MSRNFIYISLPPFIAAWLYHGSGDDCVHFSRSSVEYLIMEQFSVNDQSQADEQFGENMVKIAVPNFKYKDESYKYMTVAGKKALEQCIKDRFNIDLWKALHKFGHIGKKRSNIILAWMEANGIPDEGANWDSIEKRYQRQRDSYLAAQRQKKRRKVIKK